MHVHTNLLLIVLAAFSFASCKTKTDESASAIKDDDQLIDQAIPLRGPKQLKTLEYVFYKNNRTPTLPSDSEVQAFKSKFLALSTTSLERKLLRKVYHDRYDLMTLADRDSDGDGIKDYRVSQYWGKFSEGDLDLDGDGIRNLLDADPLDARIGGKDVNGDGQPDSDYVDVNGNTIPDHVDFALLYPEAKNPFSRKLSAIQVDLYKSHKIILVERNQPFTLQAAEVVRDAIKKVFTSTFGRSRVLPTLRSIATEDQVLLIPEEGGETHALVSTPMQTLIMYRSGLAVPPIVLLGLLTHEIGHSIQYAKDYVSADQIIENSRIYFPNPRYFKSMSPYGWETDSTNIKGLANFSLWVPAYEYIRPNFLWQKKSPDTWSSLVDDVYNSVGDSYMKDPRIAGQHIVSQYSTTDPFEWLSDNQIAYLFALIEGEVIKSLGTEKSKINKFKRNFLKTVEDAWPGFAHYNQRGSDIEKHLTVSLPISAADIKSLAQIYGNPIMTAPQTNQGSSLWLNGGEASKGRIRCRPAPDRHPDRREGSTVEHSE